LAQKYDPQSDISDDINEEKDRVEFMRSIVNLFAVKARIKLNPKKLYQADADAVGEILKIATVLYKVDYIRNRHQYQKRQRRKKQQPSLYLPRLPISRRISSYPIKFAI